MRFMWQKAFFILSSFLALTASAAEHSLHVDIRDLVKYQAGNGVLQLIVDRMEKDPDGFVNDTVNRVKLTAQERALNKKAVFFFGVDRIKPRTTDASSGELVELLRAFYKNSRGEWIYKAIEVRIGKDAATGKHVIVSVREASEIAPVSAESAKFKVRLGIEERRLIIEDEANGIKKVYAVGIGNKSGNINGRSKSEYLIGKKCVLGVEGFLHQVYGYGASACRIQVDGGHSRYLCHGPVTPELIRGWVSLGCIRMRTKDANELYEVIRTSKDTAPLDVKKRLTGEDAKYDHPYPLSSIARQQG